MLWQVRIVAKQKVYKKELATNPAPSSGIWSRGSLLVPVLASKSSLLIVTPNAGSDVSLSLGPGGPEEEPRP